MVLVLRLNACTTDARRMGFELVSYIVDEIREEPRKALLSEDRPENGDKTADRDQDEKRGEDGRKLHLVQQRSFFGGKMENQIVPTDVDIMREKPGPER